MGTIISPVQGAVIAVRKTLAGIFPADTKVRDLTDVQIEWILGAGLGGWIDARISTGILQGQTIDASILASNRRYVDLATIAAILPQLGDLGFPWSKPIEAWKTEEISGFILAAIHLTETAKQARRKAFPTLSEELNDSIPF